MTNLTEGEHEWKHVVDWADPWDGLCLREVYELVDIEARCIYTATFTNGCW